MKPHRLPVGSVPLAICLFVLPVAARSPGEEPPAARPMGPEEAARATRVPPGFRVEVYASEPLIVQPVDLEFDERGRLWVVECLTYADRKVNFDTRLRDRISILEDTDGDGRADRKKVFWEGGPRLTSLALGFGGVWALAAPRLLFLPDRDRDDVPDSDPEVLLDGWNAGPVRHNIANGLMWGPDGWLYGRHGIQATSYVGRPGDPPSRRIALNCSIWRYHPVTRRFEVVVHGTTNPWGLDYDEHGQMFFINTVIGHLWHLVPGAHYKRMYGADFNPHVYELMDQCADHYHWDRREAWSDIRKGVSPGTDRAGGGHAHCGLMIYLGDNWPERYRNDVFTVNLHGKRLNRDRLERTPWGYAGRHAPDFLFAQDPWFRGIELACGPDGAAYLLDWSDTGECHENDGVDRTSGRIYRIVYGESRPFPRFDLRTFGGAALARLVRHRNDWWVRAARRILQERAASGEPLGAARNELARIFEAASSSSVRLRALWALNATGALDGERLAALLAHRDEHVRLWALRFSLERPEGDPGPFAAEALARRAAVETSGLVRLFLASGLQRLAPPLRLPAAETLALREDVEDSRNFELLLWYGLEAAVPLAPGRAVELARRTPSSLLRRFIARRLASEIEVRGAALSALLRKAAAEDASRAAEVLEGVADALRGLRRAPRIPGWDEIAARLRSYGDPRIGGLLDEIAVVFGDGRTLSDLRRLVEDEGADPEARRNALRTLVSGSREDLGGFLLRLLDDKVLAGEAIRGLAVHPHRKAPVRILARYDALHPALQAEAIRTLSSRADYARALLEAVEKGTIPRRAVSAYHVRQMAALGDSELTRRIEKVWGRVRRPPEEKERRMEELRRLLAPERLARADRKRGRELFSKLCGRCHTLFGEGGNIGPDLTGSDRRNLAYLIENIVDPSAVLVEDFKVSAVVLASGRVVTGVVLRRSGPVVEIQTPEELVRVPRDDVLRIEPQDVSLMPEGLLDGLSEEETTALFAYLSSGAPAPPPGSRAGG